MLEQNLYVCYSNGRAIKVNSKEDLLTGEKPCLINFQVKSDTILDFTSTLLEEIANLFPEVKVNCQQLNMKGEILDEFDWRTKKVFTHVVDSLKNLSKCSRLKVCCIIVKNNRIISTGVNGTPKGFRNCSEVFTPEERLKKSYYNAHHIFSEAYEVHAEQNAILELGHNTSINDYEDLELFCSTCPCPGCAKLIAQTGIKKVFYVNDYDRLPDGAKNLQEFGITVYKI